MGITSRRVVNTECCEEGLIQYCARMGGFTARCQTTLYQVRRRYTKISVSDLMNNLTAWMGALIVFWCDVREIHVMIDSSTSSPVSNRASHRLAKPV